MNGWQVGQVGQVGQVTSEFDIDRVIVAEVNERLKKIRENNRVAHMQRKDSIYKQIPELKKIDKKLKKAGLALSLCVLKRSGNFERIELLIRELQRKKLDFLIKNGFSASDLHEKYRCKKCKDTGFLTYGRCSCFETLLAAIRFRYCSLTRGGLSQTFESFDMSKFGKQKFANEDASAFSIMKNTLGQAEKFARTFEKNHSNLLIIGNTGTGKTYLSNCIANRVADRGFTVNCQVAYKLFELIENVKFNKIDFEQCRLFLDYVYKADLLTIDDLGAEFLSSISVSAFFNILDSRLVEQKSTIINTNLNLNEIEKLYSQRVSSRLVGEYKLFKLLGNDLRRSSQL